MVHAAFAGAKSGVDCLKIMMFGNFCKFPNLLSHEGMICFQLAECRTLVQRALGFEPFLAQPMYRFGAWVALVICWLPCTAFRTVHDDLGQACPVEATPTHGDTLCLTHCFLIYVSSIHDQCQEPRCRGRYVPGMSPGVKATEVWDFKRVCFLEVICAMPFLGDGHAN